MSENERKPIRYLGTYFDPDFVLKVSRWAEVLSWVVAVVYVVDLLLAVGVFVLQAARGFMAGWGTTDIFTQIIYVIERPFRGIVYFVVLQAISKTLLILMDMEQNLRQGGRKG